MARRMVSRLRVLIAVAAVPLLLWAVLPLVSHGDPSPGQLQKKIDRKEAPDPVPPRARARADERHRRLHAPDQLAAGRHHAPADAGRCAIESDLERQARRARAHPGAPAPGAPAAGPAARAARRGTHGRWPTAWSSSTRPTSPTSSRVILESDGFADLLERTEFMERVSAQDQRIIQRVRTREGRRDGHRPEARHARAAPAEAHRRDRAPPRPGGGGQEPARRQARRASSRRARPGSPRSPPRASAATSSRTTSAACAPSRRRSPRRCSRRRRRQRSGRARSSRGSGALIWPVNGPITSPFCEARAWESCHPGIDIGVPTGTPIRAAASGKVVLLQGVGASGGYGNFTCIQHTASMSTCYAPPVAASRVDGRSRSSRARSSATSAAPAAASAPHLHFEVRINGHVVNPMNYL